MCCVILLTIIGACRFLYRSLTNQDVAVCSPMPPVARRVVGGESEASSGSSVFSGPLAYSARLRWLNGYFFFAMAGAAYLAFVALLSVIQGASGHPLLMTAADWCGIGPAPGWWFDEAGNVASGDDVVRLWLRNMFFFAACTASLVFALYGCDIAAPAPKRKQVLSSALIGAGSALFMIGFADHHIFGMLSLGSHLAHWVLDGIALSILLAGILTAPRARKDAVRATCPTPRENLSYAGT